MKPNLLVAHLDQHVIGQTDAKKTLAVAVYSHFRKLSLPQTGRITLNKSNILLIGPTGCGKSLLCETLARGLGVPFVTADATSLAQTRYVNDEIEALLMRLIDKADGNSDKAAKGIVFIDEIDKLRARPDLPQATSGENVQHALLKIMEGSLVRFSNGQYLDTSNILFICGGAFVGIERIMVNRHTYGFIATDDNEDVKIIDRLNSRIKPTDLFEYGLIPEFTGRLPVIARLHELDKPLLVRIMHEPRDSIYRQFKEIFKMEGVELEVTPRVFEQIAELALEYKVGARSLRGLFEELMTPVLYDITSQTGFSKVRFESLFNAPILE